MGWDIPDWAYLVAQSLLQTLKVRDPYTYGHCKRVARNGRLLAEAAGLSEREQTIIEYCCLFHDLGKLGIPETILLKAGPLTPSEDAVMKKHPEKSLEIIHPLRAVSLFNSTAPGILHHHERIDGAGYPFGLQDSEIPIEAKIMAIVDTFDAMTTSRPYRNALPNEVAYKELQIFSGRQFDKALVKVFLQAHPKWSDFEQEISEELLAPLYRKVA